MLRKLLPIIFMNYIFHRNLYDKTMATKLRIFFVVATVLLMKTMSTPENKYLDGPFTEFQVWEVKLQSGSDIGQFLREMDNVAQVDVWGYPKRDAVDVMVSPSTMSMVDNYLIKQNASRRIKVPNVQRLIEKHTISQRTANRLSRSINHFSAQNRYLTYNQIIRFLSTIRKNAKNVDIKIFNLGKSFEERITPYVKIREKNFTQSDKHVIVIEAGIHAREWIAPAMSLNIIQKLAMSGNDDMELLQKFDWVIIPVVNPDGYAFSHLNISNRLWRKTRSSLYSQDPLCFGVDGNRNFGYKWSADPFKGGNSNPCAENYSGPQRFSEPETKNLRSLLQSIKSQIALYISLHSYGQYFLYPWGYSSSDVLVDESDLSDIAHIFAEEMQTYNRRYTVGRASRVLYEAPGGSDDYARGCLGVKYAFTVELSPADENSYGFLLPANEIDRVVEDHWSALKKVALAVWDKLTPEDNVTTTAFRIA